MDDVYRLALAIVGDTADAADITQETFVTVWQRLPSLREADRFDAWLHRITVNAARMANRSRRRRAVREIVESELAAGTQLHATPATADATRLAAALGELTVDQRTILALHHLEDRPIAELAGILDIPQGTVKSRLFTARRALDAALAREDRP